MVAVGGTSGVLRDVAILEGFSADSEEGDSGTAGPSSFVDGSRGAIGSLPFSAATDVSALA